MRWDLELMFSAPLEVEHGANDIVGHRIWVDSSFYLLCVGVRWDVDDTQVTA